MKAVKRQEAMSKAYLVVSLKTSLKELVVLMFMACLTPHEARVLDKKAFAAPLLRRP